eukprot:scaffold306512_cov35-Tisochrysis_lutea.AAC.4
MWGATPITVDLFHPQRTRGNNPALADQSPTSSTRIIAKPPPSTRSKSPNDVPPAAKPPRRWGWRVFEFLRTTRRCWR